MEKVEDYRDPKVLRRMYWDEGKSAEEMADLLYCSTTTVLKQMRDAGIPRRPCIAYFRGKIDYRNKYILQGMVDQGLSTKEIAKKCEISPGIITRWKRRLGIKPNLYMVTESRGERFKVRGKMMTVRQIAEIAGVNASTIRGRISRGWKPEDLTKPSQWGTDFVRGRQATNLKKQAGRFK